MKRVLVIGDIISDVYRDTTFRKECPDAPGVRAVVDGAQEVRPGGAANVAVNLDALAPGVTVDLIGATDATLLRSIRYLTNGRVSTWFTHITSTPLIKERILVDGEFVLRLDNRVSVSPYDTEKVTDNLRNYLAECDPDLVVLADYAGGTVGIQALQTLLGMRERLLVDTKLIDLSLLSGTFLVKLNDSEHRTVLLSDHSPERHMENLVVTRGSRGAQLIRYESGHPSVTHTLTAPGRGNGRPVDVCGCGDTFLAALAASFVGGNTDAFTALQFANAAASTVVTQERTAVADLQKTLKMLGRTET